VQALLAAFHIKRPEDYKYSARLIVAMQTLDKYEEQRADEKTKHPESTLDPDVGAYSLRSVPAILMYLYM
jgi:hypothetical protein